MLRSWCVFFNKELTVNLPWHNPWWGVLITDNYYINKGGKDDKDTNS